MICGLVCDKVAVCGLWAWMLPVDVGLWAWMVPLVPDACAAVPLPSAQHRTHTSIQQQRVTGKKLAEQSFWSINYGSKFSFISKPSNDKSMDESWSTEIVTLIILE